jgi:Large-conductance mechanosensitive channel, MscL
MLKEFKEFIARGNVIDLARGVWKDHYVAGRRGDHAAHWSGPWQG